MDNQDVTRECLTLNEHGSWAFQLPYPSLCGSYQVFHFIFFSNQGYTVDAQLA
jgi:hypothetical protein